MTEQEINNLIDSKIGKTKMSQLPEATQTSGLYSIGYTGNQSVKYKANLLQGDPLTVRKTYQTEALALADKNPIDPTTSLPLKVGQFISIVDDGEKNGIYRIGAISGDGTMVLELQGKLGDLSEYTKTGGSTKTTKQVDDEKAEHGYASIEAAKTLKEVEDDLASDLSIFASKYVKSHNQYLQFKGFKNTSSPQLSPTRNFAYIASESGTIMGVEAIKGQIIWGDGVSFIVEDVKQSNDFYRELQGRLFNVDGFVSRLDGDIMESEIRKSTNYIPINPKDDLIITGYDSGGTDNSAILAYYDKNKEFINYYTSGEPGGVRNKITIKPSEIPIDTKYVRVSAMNTQQDAFVNLDMGNLLDDLALKADQADLVQLESDVEQLAYVKINNEAVNGNFENGLMAPFRKTDGLGGASTLAINSSTPISGNYDIRFTITTPATSQGRPFLSGLNKPGNIGDKMYIHFYAKILSGIPTIRSISDGVLANTSYSGDVINGRNTRIIDVVGTGDVGAIYFNSLSVWDMQMDNFIFINLTEIFGAGNEPTEEEMNLLISTLGIDYFEGEIIIPAQKIMQWQLKLKPQLSGDDVIKDDVIGVGTNFLSELTNSELTDTDIWGSGHLTGSGQIESTSGHYSKKYYKVTEGSYNLRAYIYANSACLLYDGGFNVISSFKTDESPFDETIIIPDNAVYIRISHLSGQNNVKYIKLTNTIPVVFQDNRILSTISKGNYDYAVNGEAVASHELEMIKRANPPKQMFPIVSFISDDGHIDNINWFIPILEEHDVKATFVAISAWNDGDYMTTEQLKDLHNKGHEIGGHTKNHARLATIPIDEAEEEIRHSALYLIDMGIEPYTFVHPFGSRNFDTDRLVRGHFKISPIATDDSTVAEGTCCNTPPIDTYGVKRLSFDSFLNYDSKLQLAKDAVDVAVSNNQWLIFTIHPQYDEYNTANPDYLSKRQDVSDLISYIKQQGARILTCKGAMRYFGNSFEVGNKRLDDIYYALGSDGNDEGSFFDRRK